MTLYSSQSKSILGPALDNMYKAVMLAIDRRVLEQTWLNVVGSGLKNSDGSRSIGFSLDNTGKQLLQGLSNGLDGLQNLFEEYMTEILAWLAVIANGIVLTLLIFALGKAIFSSGIVEKRKEIWHIVTALPKLVWVFIEYFCILFHIFPEKKRECQQCTCQSSADSPNRGKGRYKSRRSRSLDKRWKQIENETSEEYDATDEEC